MSLYKSNNPTVLDEAYDAYVILPWATFADSIAADINQTSFNWYRSLKEHKNIKVILLNLDVQQGWELNDEQKAALGVN